MPKPRSPLLTGRGRLHRQSAKRMSGNRRMGVGVRQVGIGIAIASLAACGDPATTPVADPTPPRIDTAPAPEPAAPVPGSSPEQPAYVGTWGKNRTQCGNLQEVYEAPMILTQAGYDQHESHCQFDRVTATAPDTWTAEGQCSVEGYEEPLRMTFAVNGNLLTLLDEGSPYSMLVRCPAAD